LAAPPFRHPLAAAADRPVLARKHDQNSMANSMSCVTGDGRHIYAPLVGPGVVGVGNWCVGPGYRFGGKAGDTNRERWRSLVENQHLVFAAFPSSWERSQQFSRSLWENCCPRMVELHLNMPTACWHIEMTQTYTEQISQQAVGKLALGAPRLPNLQPHHI
jgi:hypothetical protein